ncbi:putative histone-like transcription factor [Cavenderia fasciculata]|uniref:Histone-like transcription factor n=1 Tax=Cavenderia fasciculata TaxID=261658 RepID=F4QB06_CACFS|nr:putative histone-like transcription factor [Cavenderia fasciculata]EGG14778.1 putative histone-like transcription factor [Cavenderia fasciculata]|eukprot:XP_004351294.1 putative histone-like transcription factor [Cavenderia fasciculata]
MNHFITQQQQQQSAAAAAAAAAVSPYTYHCGGTSSPQQQHSPLFNPPHMSTEYVQAAFNNNANYAAAVSGQHQQQQMLFHQQHQKDHLQQQLSHSANPLIDSSSDINNYLVDPSSSIMHSGTATVPPSQHQQHHNGHQQHQQHHGHSSSLHDSNPGLGVPPIPSTFPKNNGVFYGIDHSSGQLKSPLVHNPQQQQGSLPPLPQQQSHLISSPLLNSSSPNLNLGQPQPQQHLLHHVQLNNSNNAIPSPTLLHHSGNSHPTPSQQQQQHHNQPIPSPQLHHSNSLPPTHPNSHANHQQQQQQTTTQLHQKLENNLNLFWQKQLKEVKKLDDFKTGHELPLARIKKIMKSDDEVNKISAEVPFLFSKACELFILEITLRSWVHTEMNKRRTLQRTDISNALSRSDTFDFLIDIVPRDEIRQTKKFYEEYNKGGFITAEYMQFLQHLADQQNGSAIMASHGMGMKRSVSMENCESDDMSPMSSSPKKRSFSHDFTMSDYAHQQQQQQNQMYYYQQQNALNAHHHHQQQLHSSANAIMVNNNSNNNNNNNNVQPAGSSSNNNSSNGTNTPTGHPSPPFQQPPLPQTPTSTNNAVMNLPNILNSNGGGANTNNIQMANNHQQQQQQHHLNTSQNNNSFLHQYYDA